MAHFAHLDDSNAVTRVIVISDDVVADPAPDNEADGQAFIANVLGLSGTWMQVSYNGNFRGSFPGLGFIYDADLDEFVAPPEPELPEA